MLPKAGSACPFCHSRLVRLRGGRSRRHNNSISRHCSLSLNISCMAAVVIAVFLLLVWYLRCSCCYYSYDMTHRQTIYMPYTSAVVVLSRVYDGSPRHTRKLRAVALSPEKADVRPTL